jgi:hypothetical protein
VKAIKIRVDEPKQKLSRKIPLEPHSSGIFLLSNAVLGIWLAKVVGFKSIWGFT